jgi:hypothetical protein
MAALTVGIGLSGFAETIAKMLQLIYGYHGGLLAIRQLLRPETQEYPPADNRAPSRSPPMS